MLLTRYFVAILVVAGLVAALYFILTRPEETSSAPTPPAPPKWVAVGENTGGAGGDYGNILYSSDGISWKQTEEGASFADYGNGVAYSSEQNRWVAVGSNTGGAGGGTSYGNILYSSDGTNWQPSTTGASFSISGWGVAYGNNRWVAVGSNGGGAGGDYGNILYSSDGISWKQTEEGASFATFGYGVAYGNGRWVAMGSNEGGAGGDYGNILYSSDGISWKQTEEGASFSISGWGVAYGNNRWVAVGDNDGGYGDDYGNILYSSDGISWKQTEEGASFADYGQGVAYSSEQNRWVAVGENTGGAGGDYGHILYSSDGISWKQTEEGASFAAAGTEVAYSSEQNIWVAVGGNGGGAGGDYGHILYSSDGISWKQTEEGASFSTFGYGVAFKS